MRWSANSPLANVAQRPRGSPVRIRPRRAPRQLLHPPSRPVESAQYTSIDFTQTLADHQVLRSVGSFVAFDAAGTLGGPWTESSLLSRMWKLAWAWLRNTPSRSSTGEPGMNYRLAYSVGFHPWEDAATDGRS